MHFWNLGDIKWVFIFHVIGGISALSALSIPLLSKKGGKLHVRAGDDHRVLGDGGPAHLADADFSIAIVVGCSRGDSRYGFESLD